MFKAFGESNASELRINAKHALGTTLLGPGFVFDLNRMVQTFYSRTFLLEGSFVSTNRTSRQEFTLWPGSVGIAFDAQSLPSALFDADDRLRSDRFRRRRAAK